MAERLREPASASPFASRSWNGMGAGSGRNHSQAPDLHSRLLCPRRSSSVTLFQVPSLYDLDPGPDCPELVRMIVEIPRNSTNKYEYDVKLEVFRLVRSLYSP